MSSKKFNRKFNVSNIKLKQQLVSLACGLLFLLIAHCSLLAAFAQSKLAILVPEKNTQSRNFTEKFESSLSKNFKVLDASLSETAFSSANYEKPFNLSLEESKNIGTAIGCDYFLLVKADTLRRYSFEKKEFYESYATIYVVSSRTGRLVFWKLINSETETVEKSERKLFDSINDLSAELSNKLKLAAKEELSEKPAARLEELPAENSPEAKNFRPPLPYKRIKPEYTKIANLHSIEATVDAEIEVDENGKILKTEIMRWAGFGLDESVIKTIYKMQWRPASRDGKALPLRVLLRYNFKKIEDGEK